MGEKDNSIFYQKLNAIIEEQLSIQNLNFYKMKEDTVFLIKRSMFFFIIYVFVILICGGLISHFNISPLNDDNERTLISSIIQSQAAIVAIVITLSLVAIQIAASQYSSTIVDYIKRHPDFWILLVIYIISIMYGLVVLKTLDIDHPFTVLGVPSTNFVGLEFGIAFYSVIILIPYVTSTTNLLSANKFIEKISQKIDKKSIISKDENFFLFFNIIESSMLKNDLEVATTGLIESNAIVIPIIQNASEEEIIQIVAVYDEKLTKIRITSQNLNLDYITVNACNCYYNLADTLLTLNPSDKIHLPISALHNIAKYAIENNSYFVFNTAIQFIKEIALRSDERNQQKAYELSLESLRKLGQLSISQHSQNNLALCIAELESLAEYHIKKGSESELSKIILIYGVFLDDAVLHNFLSTLYDISKSIERIENELILKNTQFEEGLLLLSNIIKTISEAAITSSQLGIFFENLENFRKMYYFSMDSKLDKLHMFCVFLLNKITKKGLQSKNGDQLVYSLIVSQQKIIEKYLTENEFKRFDVFIDTNVQLVNYLIETRQQELFREFLIDHSKLLKYLISKSFDTESSQVMNFLYSTGKMMIEKNIFDFSFIAPQKMLKEMDYDVLSKNSDEKELLIFLIIKTLGDEGCEASNAKLEKSTKSAVIFLGLLYGKCSEEGYWSGQKAILLSILSIGFTSFDKGTKEAIIAVTHQIDLLRNVVKTKIPDTELIDADLSIGSFAIERKNKEIADICATHLANLNADEIPHTDKKIDDFLASLASQQKEAEIKVVTEFRDLYQKKLSEKETSKNNKEN